MNKQYVFIPIDALIISSNKGLAFPLGLGMVVLSPNISIILQLNKRLKELKRQIIFKTNKKIKKLADYFRKNMPNVITTLTPTDGKLASQIIKFFEDIYYGKR